MTAQELLDSTETESFTVEELAELNLSKCIRNQN